MKLNGISLMPGGLIGASVKYQSPWRFDFPKLAEVTADREAHYKRMSKKPHAFPRRHHDPEPSRSSSMTSAS
jgi:hypothetical protein